MTILEPTKHDKKAIDGGYSTSVYENHVDVPAWGASGTISTWFRVINQHDSVTIEAESKTSGYNAMNASTWADVRIPLAEFSQFIRECQAIESKLIKLAQEEKAGS